MSHAFRLVAVKREADVYLSQGLHQEALSIYDKFITGNNHIQPTLKSSIEAFMHRIHTDAMDTQRDESRCLSEADILLIKKGWGGAAAEKDRLASAKAFMNLGFYEHALEEYRLLLENRRLSAAAIKGIVQCLVRLTPPQHFAMAVDLFAEEIFKRAGSRKAFKLLVARKIDLEKYSRHFLALSRHIAENGISAYA